MDQRDDWRLTELVEHDFGRGDPFAAAIRGTRMPMVITDPRQPDNPIVFANEAFQTLTGYSRNEVVGRNCRFLQGPETDLTTTQALHRAVENAEDIQVDILNYRKDGSTFWNALFLSPVRADKGEVLFFFASQLDITDRVTAKADTEKQVQLQTAELRAALEAKTLLLHEVDHRVKNNLTMIGSLLRLQARSLADREFVAILNSMIERVDALATVHRRLYQSDDVTRFDIGALIQTLATDVVVAAGRNNIEVDIRAESISVPSNQAAAVGLIVNELLTNALRHAFSGERGGRLVVSAICRDARAVITIQDDGPGFDEDSRIKGGLGMTLIQRLSRQLNAKTDWGHEGQGTRVTVDFPIQHES